MTDNQKTQVRNPLARISEDSVQSYCTDSTPNIFL